jgi:sugar (glycoside-pentoside-hexuronide) transporter
MSARPESASFTGPTYNFLSSIEAHSVWTACVRQQEQSSVRCLRIPQHSAQLDGRVTAFLIYHKLMNTQTPSHRLPLSGRLSYAASDAAGQLVFCVISFYLLNFYTDVVGISAATAGTILLIARLIDAIDAPVWGMIFDRTQSRWGKSRPWFLWLCFPFALFGVLTFCIPDLQGSTKAWYAGITYVLCSILYTGINTPVTSILSSLTPDPNERVTLTSFRMFGSKIGVLAVNATAYPLVEFLGGGNDRRGFMLTMPIFAACSILLYLIAFRNLRETVEARKKPTAIWDGFCALKGNWPWLIIFSSGLCFWIAFIARISMAPYFFEHLWKNKERTALANSLDVLSLVSILSLPWLCRRMSKAAIWALGLAGAVASQIAMYAGIINHSSFILFAGWIAGIITSGAAMAMPFALLSNSVDYGEWKHGIRAAGLLTSIGAAFCLKAGSGFGGALPAWILGATGYVPNALQSPTALRGIEIGFIWLPALFYLLALVPVLFYRKYELMECQIHEELQARRSIATDIES